GCTEHCAGEFGVAIVEEQGDLFSVCAEAVAVEALGERGDERLDIAGADGVAVLFQVAVMRICNGSAKAADAVPERERAVVGILFAGGGYEFEEVDLGEVEAEDINRGDTQAAVAPGFRFVGERAGYLGGEEVA